MVLIVFVPGNSLSFLLLVEYMSPRVGFMLFFACPADDSPKLVDCIPEHTDEPLIELFILFSRFNHIIILYVFKIPDVTLNCQLYENVSF